MPRSRQTKSLTVLIDLSGHGFLYQLRHNGMFWFNSIVHLRKCTYHGAILQGIRLHDTQHFCRQAVLGGGKTHKVRYAVSSSRNRPQCPSLPCGGLEVLEIGLFQLLREIFESTFVVIVDTEAELDHKVDAASKCVGRQS